MLQEFGFSVNPSSFFLHFLAHIYSFTMQTHFMNTFDTWLVCYQ